MAKLPRQTVIFNCALNVPIGDEVWIGGVVGSESGSLIGSIFGSGLSNGLTYNFSLAGLAARGFGTFGGFIKIASFGRDFNS